MNIIGYAKMIRKVYLNLEQIDLINPYLKKKVCEKIEQKKKFVYNMTLMHVVSTPNGLNLFYRMWEDAIKQKSEYKPIEIHWSMVPGRDEAWKEQTIRNTSADQFRQEFECEFIGSTNTLIHPVKLRSLVWQDPIGIEGNIRVYKKPDPSRTYCMTVDVAEGQGLDYSTFSIIDVSEIPYQVVATFKDNKISPFLFPTIIVQTAKIFNEAFILVEIPKQK
jgi:hypothetical protein